MTGTLFIGDRCYSSWSLRGWLLFDRFDLPVTVTPVDFMADSVAAQMAAHPPARTVPTFVDADGTVIWDSLAIAEELAQRAPEAGHWPADPALRAMARALACEMHASYHALREDCPMNLNTAYSDVTPSEAVRSDLDRIDTLWQFALDRSGGPWLGGTYSVADVFFAPVAARIAGYGLAMSDRSQDYVARHLADPAFRRWRAMGLATGQELPWYTRGFAQRPWPGPTPRPAQALDSGTPENDTCPYSGKPVTHLLEVDGRTFGVCNPTCQAKTIADPDAWPKFAALL